MTENDLDEEIVKCDFTPDEAMHRRNRTPGAVLSEGQAVFWRYSSGMLTTLLHFSLAGGEPSIYLSVPVNMKSGCLSTPPPQASRQLA